MKTLYLFCLMQLLAFCIMFFSGFGFVFPNPDWNTEVDMNGYYITYGLLQVIICIILFLREIKEAL